MSNRTAIGAFRGSLRVKLFHGEFLEVREETAKRTGRPSSESYRLKDRDLGVPTPPPRGQKSAAEDAL